MVDFQSYIDATNAWLEQAQKDIITYFKGCEQYELYAWGGNGLGLILIIVGIVLFFI